MTKKVRLVQLESYVSWEWRVVDVELTPELVKTINEEHDGSIEDWAYDNDMEGEMDLVRDKVNQDHSEMYFEDDDSNGKIEWDELSKEVLGETVGTNE